MEIEGLLFSPEDYDLASKSWRLDRNGYARTTINASRYIRPRPAPITIHAHRLVCERIFGRSLDPEKKEVCDHINRNRLDNRRENLRIVTAQINAINNGKVLNAANVYFSRRSNTWNCRITRNKKLYYLGNYRSLDEARKAVAAFKEKEATLISDHFTD